MEILVQGCFNCPFRDSADGEYGKYCNHPYRDIDVLERVIGVDGFFEHKVINEQEKLDLISKYKIDGKSVIYINDRVFIIRESSLDIGRGVPYNHYPDWCPLNKEPITIKKEN